MKVVILAGGFGTRISEESHLVPKPMIEIGNQPILWHIMKGYAEYGFNDFIICAGYKQNIIKEYFANYYLHSNDVTFDYTDGGRVKVLNTHVEPWKVTVVDTGLNTMTGGRVKRVKDYIGNEPFMLTYGDGVSDIDFNKLVEFHKSHGGLVTMSTYNIAQRFGFIEMGENGKVNSFKEKPVNTDNLINIGFMVCEPEFLDYIDGDEMVLEKVPLERAAKEGKLYACRHNGYWQCMDTLREKKMLEQLWNNNEAPWKIWKD